MRVALLTWDYPTDGAVTGLARAAHMIAHGLADVGADVTVISAAHVGERVLRAHREGEVAESGRVQRVGVADRLKKASHTWLRQRACIGHLVAPIAFAEGVRQATAAFGPFDVVEATNWYAPHAYVGNRQCLLVTRASTPAADARSADATPRDRIDLAFAHELEARAARRSNLVISNTAPHQANIVQLYRLAEHQPRAVIGLALDETTLAAGRAATWPVKDHPQRLLFVGRAERRKGFRELLDAFDILRARNDAALKSPQLHLVGPSLSDVRNVMGARADKLLSDGHLRIDQAMSDDELYAAYAAAHVVVAPSRYESYGLVYREACAFGRPLVACAEDPSASQFLRDVRCGVLAASCEGAAIADAVCEAVNPATRDAFARAGRAHAETLSRRSLGAATLAAYESAIARRFDRAVGIDRSGTRSSLTMRPSPTSRSTQSRSAAQS
ncbi:MAG: glycosyltransferase family 4 protein [Pseudomonadota bacterium]